MGLVGYVVCACSAPAVTAAASAAAVVAYFMANLPAEHVRRPAAVGAAVQHTRLMVRHDGANGAGEPRRIGPVVDLVAARRKLVACVAVDSRLEVQPAGEVRMRLERPGIAVIREAGRLDGGLRI